MPVVLRWVQQPAYRRLGGFDVYVPCLCVGVEVVAGLGQGGGLGEEGHVTRGEEQEALRGDTEGRGEGRVRGG